jgi:ribosomal protein L40E
MMYNKEKENTVLNGAKLRRLQQKTKAANQRLKAASSNEPDDLLRQREWVEAYKKHYQTDHADPEFKTCPACLSKIPHNMTVCQVCGYSPTRFHEVLPDPEFKICPACLSEIPFKATACRFCGHSPAQDNANGILGFLATMFFLGH